MNTLSYLIGFRKSTNGYHITCCIERSSDDIIKSEKYYSGLLCHGKEFTPYYALKYVSHKIKYYPKKYHAKDNSWYFYPKYEFTVDISGLTQ